MKKLLAALYLSFVSCGSMASAREIALPPAPTRFVTDTAHYFRADTVSTLDTRLLDYETKTHHQVIVYSAPTTGSTSLEDWCEAAFHKWKVGRKGIDDGLILFVFPADRKLRIQVGYGLEDKVPDAVAARIIRDDITPKFKAGDPDAGLNAGIARILAAIDGSGATSDSESSNPQCWDVGTVLFIVVFWLIGSVPIVCAIVGARTYSRLKAGKHISGPNHKSKRG